MPFRAPRTHATASTHAIAPNTAPERSSTAHPARATRRRLAMAASLASAALVLAACGGTADNASTDPTTQASAASDGRLTIYSGRAESLVAPAIAAAEEALGIEIDIRYATTSELVIQMIEEGDATPADLFFTADAGALSAVAAEGIFTTLPQDVLDRVPANFRASDGTWVGTTGRALAFVVQPEIVDEAPRTLEELTDPKWRGQVGISPTYSSFQSFITAFRMLEGEAAAEQWLRDMIANDVKLYESNTPIVEAVAAKQIKVGLVNHYYLFEVASETGSMPDAALTFAEPGNLGSFINVAGIGMTAKGATDPDALAFINYLLSDEGQAYFVETTNEYGLVPGAPAPVGVPPLESLTPPAISLDELVDLPGSLDLLTRLELI